MSRVTITDHAVIRYIERHAPRMRHDAAERHLLALAEAAAPLRARSINGQTVWRAGDPPVFLIVKPDDGRHVVVTVLPAGVTGEGLDDAVDDAVTKDVVDAYERIRSLVESNTPRKEARRAVGMTFETATARLHGQITDLRRVRDGLRESIDDILMRRAVAGDKTVINTAAEEEPSAIEQVEARIRQTAAQRREEKKIAGQLAVAQQRIETLERRLAKKIEHADREMADQKRMRDFLSVLMRAAMPLRSDPEIAEAMRRIEAMEPGLVSEKFWNRERDLHPPNPPPDPNPNQPSDQSPDPNPPGEHLP